VTPKGSYLNLLLLCECLAHTGLVGTAVQMGCLSLTPTPSACLLDPKLPEM
jgi:hypothetical protein